ncbi:MAG: RsmD family RNA methyltransferase, partial [Acidobacteriales bacterium]|nr:RsmD family RNA methyltransferase [Terriglobales bacterium]
MEETLIFYVRRARSKARACATAEAECLLNDLQARALSGGPLSDKGGLFWINIPNRSLEHIHARLPRLGYTYAVDWLEPLQGRSGSDRKLSSQIVSWRGCSYRLNRLYEEDATLLRDRAPDRRLFALEAKDGQTRLIRGYRGDDGSLSRRALPVCDARLLINLVHTEEGATFLDPFAGAGGIVLEALDSGYRVLSCDIDSILRPGLEKLGSTHYVTDARQLPFEAETVNIIATEPPFDEQSSEMVFSSLTEMYRVLKKDGRLAMLCASQQAEGLRQQAAA